MYRKTLYDIKAYLGFLDRIGCGVAVCLENRTPEALGQALGEFGILRDADSGYEEIEVSHGGHKMAAILYPAGDDCRAAAVPLKYMLERLFDQYCEYGSHDPESDAYSRALAFIREHYTEKIGVSDVSAHIGYSRSYFGYVFKKRHGIPANKYILQLRLSKAAELLAGTSLTVSAVSDKVGFEDANYFSTVFKAVYGMPPKQYRAEKSHIGQTPR